jgi:signal transduction histidine kinase
MKLFFVDKGIGIAEIYHDKIFDEGFQISDTRAIGMNPHG